MRTPRPTRDSLLTRLFEVEPEMKLPSLASSISSLVADHSFGGIIEKEQEENTQSEGMGENATPMPERDVGRNLWKPEVNAFSGEKGECDAEEEGVCDSDPPSMVLKDLLLTADTSMFGLLGEDLNTSSLICANSFFFSPISGRRL